MVVIGTGEDILAIPQESASLRDSNLVGFVIYLVGHRRFRLAVVPVYKCLDSISEHFPNMAWSVHSPSCSSCLGRSQLCLRCSCTSLPPFRSNLTEIVSDLVIHYDERYTKRLSMA